MTIESIVQSELANFYTARIAKLEALTLEDILTAQNIYLLRANGVALSSEIVRAGIRIGLADIDDNFFGEGFLIDTTQEYSEQELPLTVKLMQLIGEYEKVYRIVFEQEWAKAVNRFEREFLTDFSSPDGSIDWDKLLRFNSGSDQPRAPRKPKP